MVYIPLAIVLISFIVMMLQLSVSAPNGDIWKVGCSFWFVFLVFGLSLTMVLHQISNTAGAWQP